MSERSLVNGMKSVRPRNDRRATMRERILDAAMAVVLSKGVTAATTKRIAAEAGVAEGSLYNHFPDKARLLVQLVLERMPGIRPIFERLEADAAARPLEERLSEALVDMVGFYAAALPILGGIASDPQLLQECRLSFGRDGSGPQRAHEKLAAILAAEQTHGRLDPKADSTALAFLLIGACTEYAMLSQILGKAPGGVGPEDHVSRIMSVLCSAPFGQY